VPQGGEDAKEGRAVAWGVEKKICILGVITKTGFFGRSLKRQNTQNRIFLFLGVITKIKGSMENPHKSMKIMIITS
jgi:hypothetical protein